MTHQDADAREIAVTQSAASPQPGIKRMILVPGLITLAVTILRLAGELQQWSYTWFNPAPGGAWSIVGIVWLAPVFGIYFGFKLAAGGEGPPRAARAIGFAVLGVIVFALGFVLFQKVVRNLTGLALMWALAAASAALQLPAWRGLFKVLVAYGYAARIPVAIIMYIATQRDWKSHYSALAFSTTEMSKLAQFVLFGFIPQLLWWVSFTIVVGTLFGAVAVAIAGAGKKAPQPAL